MYGKLPTKWHGPYTEVLLLSDIERQKLGLSHEETIVEIIGHDAKADVRQLRDVVAYAKEKGTIVVDTETTGLNPWSDQIILVQVGDAERQYLIWWQTLHPRAKEIFLEFWQDPDIEKVGVNLKFDAKMFLGQEGMHWRGANLCDVQLNEQILCCGLLGSIGMTMKLTGLGALARRWLGLKMPKDEEIRTGWGAMTPGEWGKDHSKRYYAADDCVVPLKVRACQEPWIDRFALRDTADLESEFLPVLAEMEMRGLNLDVAAWRELLDEAREGLYKAIRDLDRLFQVTITCRMDLNGNVEISRDKNFGSKDQLKILIRDWMKQHMGVDVICNNEQFREALAKNGANEIWLEKKFAKRLVPNPDDPTGVKKKRVGFPKMTDYIEGSEFVDSLWDALRDKLPPKAFALPSTNSRDLKLLRILHETPDDEIEDSFSTRVGLPPELVDPILALREYGTKVQRYGESWIQLIEPVSGRIHSDFTQTAASTGRLTSRPNFQNAIADSRYRACIRASKGKKIVGADWSQIEPRITAELSNCAVYMRVFWSDRPGTKGFKYWCGDDVTEPLDLYGAEGAVLGILPKEAERKSVAKLPEHAKGRKKMKIGVLGLSYGTGKPKFHISYILDTGEYHSRDESDEFVDSFWLSVPEIKETLDAYSAIADPEKSKRREWHPYVEGPVTWAETLSGRKRFFDPTCTGWWTQGRNQPIQGLSADILKRTCIRLSNWLIKHDVDGGLILTVHDETLAEVPEEDAERVAKAMERIMSKVGEKYCRHVPITADAYVADYWVKD